MGKSMIGSVLCLAFFFGLALGSVDFCQNHLYENITRKNVVRFSKENSDKEFAVIDGFKSLHCCSQGYRSIEWFKNGTPYPWSTDVSTLIISPESGNQTIYSQGITETDSGQYWCIVRNDTYSLRHEVFLKVSGPSQLEEPPKATYAPRNQSAGLGTDARLYCEAFVGNISLPDAKSEINWRKTNMNTTVPIEGRVRQEIVSREGNQILGSYLFISDLKMEDYGQYICTVSNTGDQFLELTASLSEEVKTITTSCLGYYHPKGLIIIVTLLIVLAILVTVFFVYFRSRVTLIYRHFCQETRSKHNEEYDVLVIYHSKDSEIALKKIVFTLQNSYHCKCVVHAVKSGKLVCKGTREKANNSKRVIILLSPALAENEWTCRKLNTMLGNAINIHPRIIVVLLQPLPLNDHDGDSGALQDVLKRTYCVEYEESRPQKFRQLLALGLPVCDIPSENREIDDLV